MSPTKPDEIRDDVPLTNLDQALFDEAGATKRDLIDYLDGVRDRILPVLEDRPLSVIRVHRGQEAFMQKNVPKYTPDWIRTVPFWAETSKREVSYALCDDRRTLLWFGNQRAIEYHPALVTASDPSHMTHLVLDLDPPEGDSFPKAVQAVRPRAPGARRPRAGRRPQDQRRQGPARVRPDRARDRDGGRRCGHAGHRFRAAALDPDIATTEFVKDDRGGRVFVDSTRVGGGTVISAYSPRVRPGVPVSFPVSWDDLDDITPADFTVHTALERLGDRDPWADQMPDPQALSAELIEEGGAIPVGRVAAMHEGKRRKRAEREG